MGTALRELSKFSQSLECYKKATEIDPGQIYAWQGIILVHEKQGNKTHPDLLDAYKQIANFYEQYDRPSPT
jgi:tetratricopeptide (TPR) repeat protein